MSLEHRRSEVRDGAPERSFSVAAELTPNGRAQLAPIARQHRFASRSAQQQPPGNAFRRQGLRRSKFIWITRRGWFGQIFQRTGRNDFQTHGRERRLPQAITKS